MSTPLLLAPGDYFFGRHEGLITTLLGSCVAVVCWHPLQRLVAVTHYVLPQGADKPHDTRFGAAVFERLCLDMSACGTVPGDYRKCVFGGAQMVPDRRQASDRVGHRNAAFARDQFALRGWQLSQSDVGGLQPRHLRIDGRSGAIHCHRTPLPAGYPVGERA